MSIADWLSSAAVLVVLALLAGVALERNRLKHQLANAEGAVTGLGLDLEAMAERVAELQSYLSTQESWSVDARVPAALSDPTPPTRWTRPSDAPLATTVSAEPNDPSA